MMRIDDPAGAGRFGRQSSTSPLYSLVRVEEVAYAGDDLAPVPGYIVQGGSPPETVDPDGIVGGSRDGFLVGIHATDPPVGPGDTSLGSLIGLTVRPAGEYRDLAVPVVPNLTELRAGQTMPPNPDSAGATLVAKVWRFAPVEGIPVPRPVTVDGDALQAGAEMTGGLDRNADVPTFVLSGTRLAPSDG